MKSKVFRILIEFLFFGAYFTGARASSVWIAKHFSFNDDLVIIVKFLSSCLFLFVLYMQYDFITTIIKKEVSESDL